MSRAEQAARCDIQPAQTFGSWLIAKVQSGIGVNDILAGDPRRQNQIRKDFDEWAAVLVAYAVEQGRAMRDDPAPAGEGSPTINLVTPASAGPDSTTSQGDAERC